MPIADRVLTHNQNSVVTRVKSEPFQGKKAMKNELKDVIKVHLTILWNKPGMNIHSTEYLNQKNNCLAFFAYF